MDRSGGRLCGITRGRAVSFVARDHEFSGRETRSHAGSSRSSLPDPSCPVHSGTSGHRQSRVSCEALRRLGTSLQPNVRRSPGKLAVLDKTLIASTQESGRLRSKVRSGPDSLAATPNGLLGNCPQRIPDSERMVGLPSVVGVFGRAVSTGGLWRMPLSMPGTGKQRT
jgi:hypothetical protein